MLLKQADYNYHDLPILWWCPAPSHNYDLKYHKLCSDKLNWSDSVVFTNEWLFISSKCMVPQLIQWLNCLTAIEVLLRLDWFPWKLGLHTLSNYNLPSVSGCTVGDTVGTARDTVGTVGDTVGIVGDTVGTVGDTVRASFKGGWDVEAIGMPTEADAITEREKSRKIKMAYHDCEYVKHIHR